jgi:predicted nucleotidyltransferase
MVTQQAAIETVKQFAVELKNGGINIKRIILYGSYAKGLQKQHSDIDVAIVADEFKGVGFIDLNLFLSTMRKYYTIQPKTYSTSYFAQGDPFIDTIKKEGIDIIV